MFDCSRKKKPDHYYYFYRVNRELLWEILANYVIRGPILDDVRAVYGESEGAEYKCRIHATVSRSTRKGCVLSTLMFITYIDIMNKRVNITRR